MYHTTPTLPGTVCVSFVQACISQARRHFHSNGVVSVGAMMWGTACAAVQLMAPDGSAVNCDVDPCACDFKTSSFGLVRWENCSLSTLWETYPREALVAT